MVSTPFARITGTSGKFSFKNFFNNIFKVPGKPGVAYLQPEGFRYSPTTRVTNFIGDQKFPYSFNRPARPGYADVPGIKSEIEAIFRPDAGGYTVSSQKFYTTIKGVNVPIDTFTYDPSVVSTSGAVNLQGGASSYSGYSLTRSYPVVPLVTSSLVTPTSTTSITPAYSSTVSYSDISSSTTTTSITPSYSSPSSSGGSRSRGRSSQISSAPSIVPSSLMKPSMPPKSSKLPSISNLYSGASSTSSSSIIYSGSSKPPVLPSFLRQSKQPQATTKGFQVFGRRFGQFKLVGVGKTERQAINFGKVWAGKTLGATFKVPKAKRLKVPGFKTKKSKQGDILFVEPRKRRLKRGSGEIPEIQTFRRVKGGKKK
jgi:hypothetical protein